MARKPERDWILSEEAADILGITGARFRDYLIPEVREKYLSNSVLIGRTWLHYIGDVEKLKAYRAVYVHRKRAYKSSKKADSKAQEPETDTTQTQ